MSATLGFVATLAEMEQFYRGDKAGQIIELMNKTNDIMDDVPWMEANQSDGHLTRIRTGLPAVYWRRLYQGTPPAKSQWSQVKEGCGILEAIMELDVEEIRLYGDRDRSFRMSEGIAFAEAMRQKVARTLFYGDSNRNPDEFNGLAMRYPASDAENVLDAGGRDGGCTSLWLVSWGPQSVHGIYPKGSRGGLSHEDLKTYMAQDENGRKYQVTGDKYNWRCGLAVRDWRGVVRIANVPVAALGKRKGEEGFVDLHDHRSQEPHAPASAPESRLVRQLRCAHRAGTPELRRRAGAAALRRILRRQGRSRAARPPRAPVRRHRLGRGFHLEPCPSKGGPP